MSAQPTASIIISAYNRPKVVAFAIESVLASDFDDWEMIIIGDGCNAETQAAINAFSDPRIKFHNLPENTGHQSAPYNKGVEMARLAIQVEPYHRSESEFGIVLRRCKFSWMYMKAGMFSRGSSNATKWNSVRAAKTALRSNAEKPHCEISNVGFPG